MYNLYFKDKLGKIVTAIEKPFQTESEFEKYLMDTKELFSDIFILKRQVNVGRDIPDMIGIDRDNNIVIIENKNVSVNEDILPQVLRYAIWAETNPDSIRAMWLEAKNRPDDIKPDWDNADIRVIVLAPSIKSTVPKLLKRIDYNIELIEVKKFSVGNEECVLLNKLEEEIEIRVKSAKGMANYDREFYKENYNNNSVDKFFKLADEIDNLNKRKGWNLERKFNKNYVGFKSGFPNVFGINWLGSKSLGFFFKMPITKFVKFQKLSPYETEYDERWRQATIRHEDGMTINSLEKVLGATYNWFMENK